jgi:hypothetical protein
MAPSFYHRAQAGVNKLGPAIANIQRLLFRDVCCRLATLQLWWQRAARRASPPPRSAIRD